MASNEIMETYDEEDSLTFSQLYTPLSQNPSRSPLDMYATPGKLDKIVLTNFMCHKHIEVTFHENVNVILGRNGSGKSAIMAAIIVGLGGKAIITSRKTSLQQFIRTGSSFAEIKLTLSNVGRDSYQPQVYGRRVVVVRKIQKDGSSYKIMNVKGQVISTKKDDLIKILDRFNIQVDNPVSLLNQETSRNFLHSTNPATLYQLLMKATQLDSILRDYEHAKEQEALMWETINNKNASVKKLEVEVKKLEELYNSSQGLQSLEEKRNRCAKELKWAYVKEIEQEAKLQESKIAKEPEKISKNETKLREFQEEARQMEANERKICSELEQVNEQAQTIESHQEAAQTALRARQKEKQKIQQTINGIRQKIKSKENERTALEKKIEETKQVNFADHHAEHEQLLRQLEEAKQRRIQLLEEIDQCRNALQKHRDAASEYGSEHQHIMEQNDNLMSSIRDCRNSISKLKSGSGHKMDIFGGQWMISLVDAIKNNRHRFHQQPMGPLGSMVTIKDQKWTIAIQKCIGTGNLHAFVVDNANDGAILRQIMKEVFQCEKAPLKLMPFIIQYHYSVQPYSCSSWIPGCAHPTVLSQLNISNAICENVIIDHCKVESTILMEDDDDAEHFMLRPPSGVTSCYTLNGDQHLPGGEFCSRALFYSDWDDPKRTKIYLATSKEHLVRIQQEQLTSLEQENLELDSKMEHVRVSMDAAKSGQQNAQTYLSRLQQAEFRVKQRIEELTGLCEEAQELKEEDIATYEEEVKECNEAIDELREQVQEHMELLDATTQQIAKARKEVEAARNDADTLTQRIESIQQSHAKAQQLTRKVHFSIDRYRQHIDKIKETLTGLNSTLRDINSRLSDAISQAESGDDSERIDTDRSARDIILEIEQIDKTIKDQEKQVGNREKLSRDLSAALEHYNVLTSELEVSHRLMDKLNVTMHIRMNLVKRWRESVSTRITGQFHTLMSQRGVKGSMNVDHEKGELILMVKFHEEQSSLATKNTKSLSGGERSFSTVALIMSLWEVTDSPFRMLDEFDVFMDMMNRRISMGMMLELARKQPHKQFVFLSPQDMSTVIKGGDYMKIIKMDDLDRSQTTLD